MRYTSLSVLFAAAECAPFAKVGGLGDVIGSLPQALAREGARVSVILPKYAFLSRLLKFSKIKRAVSIEYNGKQEMVEVYTAEIPHTGVIYYFIDHPILATNEIYASAKRLPKPRGAYSRPQTDVVRFTFFSKAVVEAIEQLPLPCDVLHCHDWHTGYIPTFVDSLSVTHRYPNTPTIFTIHNLANQGIAMREIAARLGLHPDETPSLLEDYYDHDKHSLNAMKLGVLSSSLVTTVSPTYAQEVMTLEHGAGLALYLTRRKKHLYGILNGIDTNYYNPATDKHIFTTYTQKNVLKGKAANKQKLQKLLKLPKKNVPVYGLVSRLVPQKGLDILLQTLPEFFKNNIQVAILGAGEKILETALRKLARRYPKNMSVTIHFDIPTAQRIYAASDFFLMPSLFEPCGLGQMIAMRYGAIPIVRATGGLKDTVRDYYTGIVFTQYTETALLGALNRSLALYANKDAWYTVVARAMKQDFSWERSAREYIRLYKKIA